MNALTRNVSTTNAVIKYGALSAMAVAAAGIAGCASVDRAEISPEAEERLADFERTGEMRTCLNLRAIDQIDPLDERHFLVRVGLNDYYLNEISGRCSGAGRFNNRIQYTTSISQLCRNEIITIVDNSTGFTMGSCGLGSFERLVEKPDEEEEEAAS